jgi:hypothetical protein
MATAAKNHSVWSLIHGHAAPVAPSEASQVVLNAVTLSTFRLAEREPKEKVEEKATAQASAPLGSVRISIDTGRLSQTPPVAENTTTANTAIPPAEPRFDGYINDALHCRALAADCAVFCLPGNTLSLAGWTVSKQNNRTQNLCEYCRIDLQDKVPSYSFSNSSCFFTINICLQGVLL